MSRKTIRGLDQLELFTACRRSTLASIDRIGCTLDVGAGRTLCDEGSLGLEFFVLVDGLVEVQKNSAAVAVLHPGAWFGEVALIDHNPHRRASVVARTPSTLIVYDKAEFGALLYAASCVKTRVVQTASCVIQGGAPTQRRWYEPLAAKATP